MSDPAGMTRALSVLQLLSGAGAGAGEPRPDRRLHRAHGQHSPQGKVHSCLSHPSTRGAAAPCPATWERNSCRSPAPCRPCQMSQQPPSCWRSKSTSAAMFLLHLIGALHPCSPCSQESFLLGPLLSAGVAPGVWGQVPELLLEGAKLRQKLASRAGLLAFPLALPVSSTDISHLVKLRYGPLWALAAGSLLELTVPSADR